MEANEHNFQQADAFSWRGRVVTKIIAMRVGNLRMSGEQDIVVFRRSSALSICERVLLVPIRFNRPRQVRYSHNTFHIDQGLIEAAPSTREATCVCQSLTSVR
jgi:hypothetical protein